MAVIGTELLQELNEGAILPHFGMAGSRESVGLDHKCMVMMDILSEVDGSENDENNFLMKASISERTDSRGSEYLGQRLLKILFITNAMKARLKQTLKVKISCAR
jgi:hypothetical protein